MKKSQKKSSTQQPAVEAILAENRKLRKENREIQTDFQELCRSNFLITRYSNWLEHENKRLLDCMHHGATAMMNYQESFQN